MLGKNIDEIDGDTIKSLIDRKVRESKYLEFKRETCGNKNADKTKFLKGISAFANTLGGHLIIGMDEEKGIASSLKSISENVDEELRRLEDMACTGIEPPILGLDMKPIDIDDKNIIVIYVPRSSNPPHRVKLNGKYYGRKSASVKELSREELRQLFSGQSNSEQSSIEERAKTFIGQRFQKIQANDGIVQLSEENGTLVMHLVPLPDFEKERCIDVGKIRELYDKYSHFQLMEPLRTSSRKIHSEGYCIYDNFGHPCLGYTQIFQNGVIEVTNKKVFWHDKREGFTFPARALPESLICALNNYMKGLRKLEITPPILLQISMMGIKGLSIYFDGTSLEEPSPYKHDVLDLPASVISEFRADKNYQSVMAKQMHSLWNAFGLERCFYFNENDEWDPPRR